jgi:replicative superfamily II helicase
MLNVDDQISPAFSSAANSFLKKTESTSLQALVNSLEKLYVYRALNINSNLSDEESAKRLIQIAIPLESQLFHSEEQSDELSHANSLVALIFEYAAKLEQNEYKRNEFWLRASLAYLQAKKSANSIVVAKKVKHVVDPSDEIESRITPLILSFLSRDIITTLRLSDQLTKDLEKELNPNKIDSIEKQYRVQGYLELTLSINDASEFLKYGTNGKVKNYSRHMELALAHFQRSGDDYLVWLTSRLSTAIKNLLENALWNLTSIIPKQIVEALTQNDERPIYDLWESQILALRNILSDNAKRHHSLIMPTSSGKTLVATIIAAKELLEKPGNCFYVTPYRALVSEIWQFMNRYLPDLGLQIKHLPGEYDSIPDLENLIAEQARIYVLTPEKLDLLWRLNDPRIKDSCVFIFDEIQNVIGEGRGLRLELLVSRIKKSYGYFSRIILLSAVIPENNAVKLVEWLGSQNSDSSFIKWSPTKSFHGIFYREKKHLNRGSLTYVNKFHIISILPSELRPNRRKETSELAIKYQKHLGPVLVYCNSKDEAQKMAELIFQGMGNYRSDDLLAETADYVSMFVGSDSVLPQMIRSGIAYHHASLPNNVKSRIERLGRDGYLDVICCTSTLAEGVNLNVGTVIISSVYEGGVSMEGMKLQNLAGRAGRALKDTEGHVILMESSFNQIFTEPDYIRFQSRFYQYMLSVVNDPMYTQDVEVIESDLLARFYKNEISTESLEEGSRQLLTSTLFAKQATTDQFNTTIGKLKKDMTRVITSPYLKPLQLRIFAETGLGLEHCSQLDENLKKIDINSLKFRENGLLNLDQIANMIHSCMLQKTRFSENALQKVHDKIGIIMDWISGKSITNIAQQRELFNTKSLNDLTNFLYGYVADELSWTNAAFVKLIDSKVSEIGGNLDYEYYLLPSYLKYGVSNPAALLLSMSGLEERDLVNTLSINFQLINDKKVDWINVISWVLGLDNSKVKDAQNKLMYSVGTFNVSIIDFSGQRGNCEIGIDGRILQSNKTVGRIANEHLPLLKILDIRKCAMFIISTAGVAKLQITPA